MGLFHATSDLVFILDFAATYLYKQLLHPRKSGPSLLVSPVREAEAGDFHSKERVGFDPKKEMTIRTPGTPASKIDRTPATTPGGAKAKEEKIVVTVRLRPLNKKEQLAKDQVAWDCVDDHTIVFKPPSQERAAQPASFVFGNLIAAFFLCAFAV
jgi:hypothetical protein